MNASISAKIQSTPQAYSAPTKPQSKVLPIYSVTPFTLLDYPGKTACIIWFSGCNMRCHYCHNPQIVKGRGMGTVADVINFLKKRQGLLDGVVLSGGEASAYSGLEDFIRTIRELGYAVKLDTNGLRPDTLGSLLNQGFLDYVALDYKAPPEKFKKVTGVDKFKDFHTSLRMLMSQHTVPFELRTTVHTSLLDETDLRLIMRDLDQLGYSGTYYVQNFRDDNARPSLGLLPPQSRQLDLTQLCPSPQYQLEFRNF